MNYEQKVFERVIKARRSHERRIKRGATFRMPVSVGKFVEVKTTWYKRLWNKFKMLWQRKK